MEEGRVYEPRFVEVLNKVISSLPKDETITSSIQKRLEVMWNKARVEDISQCLGYKEPITLHEARELIFFPSSKHAEIYCELIKPPPPDHPKDHPQVKVQIEFLTILYLHHIPQGDWHSFIQPFVLAGGFESLAMSFAHPNLYLRGQAVDAFLQITASASFDWWSPLTLTSSGTVGKQGETKKLLHLKMANLYKSDFFLSGLLVNSAADKSWPGGPTQCLQLLASWLSWCRTLYTPNQSLRLSRSLLAAIQQWGDNLGDGDLSLQDYESQVDVSEGAPPELVEFRLKMLADFGREPAIEGPEFVNGVRTIMVEGIIPPRDSVQPLNMEPVIELDEEGGFDISEPKVVKPPTPPPIQTLPLSQPFKPTLSRDFTSVSEPVSLSAKERGNKAFSAGLLREALVAYDEALEALGNTDQGREYAVIQCNRATVFLGLSKESALESVSESESFLLKAVEAAKLSVDADGTYSKANYRLAQCLEASGKVKAALTALKSSVLLSKDRKQPKKNSRVPKSELIEMAATEKLLVSLMEKLALEIEARDSLDNQPKSEKVIGGNSFTGKEENNPISETPDQSASDLADKSLELEASILVKILRRKDAKTRHDYLAGRSKAEEGKAASELDEKQLSDSATPDDAPPTLAESPESESGSESSPTPESESSSALVSVGVSPTSRQPLKDSEVAILAEEKSEELTRKMLELSKGEDSDDDEVVARVKQARAKQATKQKKAKKKEKEEDQVVFDVSEDDLTSSSSHTAVRENISMDNLLVGEEAKGQKALKKMTLSEPDVKVKSSSKKKSVNANKGGQGEKDKKRDKLEKKSQMDELRRIAKSAPADGLFS